MPAALEIVVVWVCVRVAWKNFCGMQLGWIATLAFVVLLDIAAVVGRQKQKKNSNNNNKKYKIYKKEVQRTGQRAQKFLRLVC